MRTELDARKRSNDFLDIMDKSQVLEREEHVAEHFNAIQYIETSKDIKCVSVQIVVNIYAKSQKHNSVFQFKYFPPEDNFVSILIHTDIISILR